MAYIRLSNKTTHLQLNPSDWSAIQCLARVLGWQPAGTKFALSLNGRRALDVLISQDRRNVNGPLMNDISHDYSGGDRRVEHETIANNDFDNLCVILKSFLCLHNGEFWKSFKSAIGIYDKIGGHLMFDEVLDTLEIRDFDGMAEIDFIWLFLEETGVSLLNDVIQLQGGDVRVEYIRTRREWLDVLAEYMSIDNVNEDNIDEQDNVEQIKWGYPIQESSLPVDFQFNKFKCPKCNNDLVVGKSSSGETIISRKNIDSEY